MTKDEMIAKLKEREEYRMRVQAELFAIGGQIVMLQELIKEAEASENKPVKE